MLRYSKEARESAMSDVNALMVQIAHIPGDVLPYLDAHRTIQYLAEFRLLLEKENKEQEKR